MEDKTDRKKFMFYDSSKRQADFRIRLQYDGMNQSDFFRAMLTGYLEQDPNVLAFLDSYKQKKQVQGINKRQASKAMLNKGEQTKKKFALGEDDIENIFDILEKEHPDL